MSGIEAVLSSDNRTVTVRVPMQFRRHGGRKVILAPDLATGLPDRSSSTDTALIKALARAFRWRNLLEEGGYETLAELAKKEKVNPSYVSRTLRLTLLAPSLVEAVLDGRQSSDISLSSLQRGFPIEWVRQLRRSPSSEP